MKTRWLLFYILLFGSLYSDGQINESDTVGFQLSLSTSGLYQSGNVEFYRWLNSASISYRWGAPWVLKSENKHMYQAFFRQKADEDYAGQHYLYYRPFQRTYPYAIGHVSSSFRRNIEWRYFAGAGFTYQGIQNSAEFVKTSINLVYEESRFASDQFNKTIYNGSDIIRTFRATAYLRGRHPLSEGRAYIYYEIYWQPSLDKFDNNRYQILISAGLNINQNLAITSQWTYNYESIVNQGIKAHDSILSWAIRYHHKTKSSKK